MATSIPNPGHVVLITSRGKAKVMGKDMEKDNVMTAEWHTQVSFSPLIWAVSIGKKRFSEKLISQSRCFCINFMPYSMKDKILLAGASSGEYKDKFKEIGLEKEECEKIDCIRVKGNTGFLECEVENIVEAGDHFIFIDKVIFQQVKNDKRLIHVSGNEFTTTIN